MASISLDPVSKTYRIQFRYGGRQFNRSLKTKSERDAKAIRGRVDETLALLSRGRLQLPPGADPGTFILSDGKLEGKPVIVIPKELTLPGLFDAYNASLPEGAKEANTLRTEKIHQAHARRLLGPVLVASITFKEVQAYADRRGKERFRGRPTNPETIRKGCDRASATRFGEKRLLFCPRGPSVPMMLVREP
jgi:hypothetical protein